MTATRPVPSPPLPGGLSHRPLTPADAAATYAVFAAAEKHDTGDVSVELEDIEGDWQRPSFDLASHSVGVFEGRDAPGRRRGLQGPPRRGDGPPRAPRPRDRHLARALDRGVRAPQRRDRRRADRAGRQLGRADVQGSGLPGGLDLLGPGGPSRARRSSRSPCPTATGCGTSCPGRTRRRRSRSSRTPSTSGLTASPRPSATGRPTPFAAPASSPGSCDWSTHPQGEPVGAAFTIHSGDFGYVDQVAVRADQRGRGLARSLLADAFERAREKGLTRSELSTDSRTGALPLYEHVGMVVTKTYRHWMTDV